MSFSIQRLNLQKLTLHEREIYRTFLDQSLWPCLKEHDPWGISGSEIFAVGAIDEKGRTIGLAIAVYYRYTFLAQLLSLRTNEDGFDHTIQEQLLFEVAKLFREQDCLVLTHTYSSLAPNVSNLESLFQKAGGGAPQLLMVRCHFDLQAFNPEWFNRYRRAALPAEIEFLPWGKLSSQEHLLLVEMQEQRRFPASVSPLYEEKTRDPKMSLVARYQGELIGWIILHRIANDTIRFSTFFVESDFRTSKVPGHLLVQAIVLAQQSKTPKAIFEFNLEQTGQRWIDFVKKRLAPYAQQIERIYEIGISLKKM